MARIMARIEGVDAKGNKVSENAILANAAEGIDPEGFYGELRKLSPWASWKSLTVYPAAEGEPIPSNIPEWARQGAKHLQGPGPYSGTAPAKASDAKPAAPAAAQPVPAPRG